MKEFNFVIQNQTGLHARPAKTLANLAKTFQSSILIQHGNKQVNAKSLVSLLTLGVERGSMIYVIVEGVDEKEAGEALSQAIQDGLGEGTQHPTAVPRPEAKPQPAVMPQPAGTVVMDLPIDSTQKILQGVACSPGISIGPVFWYHAQEIKVDCIVKDSAEETSQFNQAIDKARAQLRNLQQKMPGNLAAVNAAIMDVHIELLDDSELIQPALEKIQNGQGASAAWREVYEAMAESLAKLKDPLLAARAADIRDVGQRVLKCLAGVEDGAVTLPDHPVILLAGDLSPSDTAGLDKQKVLGFCLVSGGATSHTAIIARALGLPAVAGLGETLRSIKDQTRVVVNGSTGLLTLEPTGLTLEQAEQAAAVWQKALSQARSESSQPAVTRDGQRIQVVANIGSVADAQKVLPSGAEGVGLLRTEFLFLNRTTAPTEDEQFDIYSQIGSALKDTPLVVRTMDIGGDKPLPYIQLKPESNPFLGVRGVRLSLAYPELLRQQLRAIYRSARKNLTHIMFPMVADFNEWKIIRRMADEERRAVHAPEAELGIMIEVPSAALAASVFARETDFFSIGTNDLTQYTMAMDRGNPELARQADGLHPAVLRLIAMTVEAAHQAHRWVGICGELGSDPAAVPVLLGLGVDELSVNLAAVPLVKSQVRSLNLAEARCLAASALACDSAVEVRALTSPKM
jgi:phosphoenolpyruvate-protein phosphotransferase